MFAQQDRLPADVAIPVSGAAGPASGQGESGSGQREIHLQPPSRPDRPPPPAPPTRTSSTIDPPPWHLLEPPLGHINQGLSGSEAAAAARENGKAGDTEDRGAAKTEFNAVR